MSRQIITAKSHAKIGALAADEEKPDKYTDMVLKLIPAEFVSVYLGAFTLIDTYKGTGDKGILQWVVFALTAVVLYIYLKKTGVQSNSQMAFTLLAFALWVVTIGGPFADKMLLGYPSEFLGAIFLPIYTLLIPVIYKQAE